MSRVLLVNMPFSSLRWPNIGPSLLKAALARCGVGCDIAYLNFDFAERIGLEDYSWIADHFGFVLGGERLFARHYFGAKLPNEDAYRRNVLLPADPNLSQEDLRDYERTFAHVEPFLEACVAAVDWSQYAVVGFTTSFQQTLSALCLAGRIKQLRPQTTIFFGGAACAAEMGIELLRQLPQIDYVFLGEADLSFPAVVEQILSGEGEGDSPIFAARKLGQSPAGELPPGVVRRDPQSARLPPVSLGCTRVWSAAVSAAPSGQDARAPLDVERFLVRDLDALPYPDFDDYFSRLERSPLRAQIEPLLFFETSRGCWWGQQHHCVFCGLNGATLRYRSKSPQRAIDELRYLVERYGVHRANSSDNILDRNYFDTLLPMLREANIDLRFVYEMKTNLTRGQVETLLAAGLGAAQLGIETFSTPVLKLIGKGAGAMQNLQALRWFSEAGIEVKWNLLYGFPNEDPAEYAALAELLPALYHLAPPLAIGRVRLDRFSPYFENPAAHGMSNVRPNRAFCYVYPFAEDVLARLAYYHEYDYADGRDPLNYAAPLLEAADAWQQLQGTVTLRSWDRPDGLLILTDTRPAATAFQWRLTGMERAVYLYCDTGRTLGEIAKFAKETAGSPPADGPTLRRMLDAWVAARLMARLDDRYLSLALCAPSGSSSGGQ
jgi:ribosomal peptide maturation radical SAM protein 1